MSFYSYKVLFAEQPSHTQATTQIYALAITLAIALVSGALTGLLLNLNIFDNMEDEELFDDTSVWEVW